MKKMIRVTYPNISRVFLFSLFFVCITLVAYYRVVSYDFVHLDDTVQLTFNKHVLSGFSWNNFVFSCSPESWCSPFTWFTYTLAYELFGLNPVAFHILNLVVHIANSLLLFSVLMNMTGAFWQSAFVSVIFALHPMNVETVAWVAELNNVLSGFFLLMTLFTYRLYTQRHSSYNYLLCLVAFAIGLLAKPLLITLPLILLLMDIWPLRRIVIQQASSKRMALKCNFPKASLKEILYEKIPFFALSFVSLVSNLIGAESRMGMTGSDLIPLSLRVSNAIVSYVKYLIKLFLPLDLSPLYTFPDHIPLWHTAGSVLILAFFTILAVRKVYQYPYILVGWLWFLGSLVPCLGIVQAGQWAEIADRYAYHSYIGIFFILSWGIPDLLRGCKRRKALLAVSFTLTIFLAMFSTWSQVKYWKDSTTLFERIIQVNPTNYFPHLLLGNVLREKGQTGEALRHLNKALSIENRDSNVYLYLGQTLEELGNKNQALKHYSQGIMIEPSNFTLQLKSADLLVSLERLDEASNHYYKAISLNPKHTYALVKLGDIQLKAYNANGAVRWYLKALENRPHDAHIYNSLGKAYVLKADLKNALTCFKNACTFEPRFEEAQHNYKKLRMKHEAIEDSIKNIEQSLDSDPDNASHYSSLGNLYIQKGDVDKASDLYNKALSLKENHIEAMYGLAIVSAERKDFRKSIEVLMKALEIQPNNPSLYYNVACIYAKDNKSDESIYWLKKSIAKGFKDMDMIRKDPDLENIRRTPYVKMLVNN